MDTKTGLDILECEIAQIEATVYTLKRCLQNLRDSVMSEDEQMDTIIYIQKEIKRWITKDC